MIQKPSIAMKKHLPADDKPFVCQLPLCQMRCTTEDQLEQHKKRHDVNGNDSKHFSNTDQTPTPTRFFRNCEEVGLFQDLQNEVNPFEETFRKAVEATKSGESPTLHMSNGLDDTLHTPVIIHPSNEQQLQQKTTSEDKPGCSCQSQPAPVQSKSKFVDLKNNAQLFNVAIKLPIPRLHPAIKVSAVRALSVTSNNSHKVPCKKSTHSADFQKSATKTRRRNNEDLKESNRMAAIRARQKRKQYLESLEQLNKNMNEKTKELELVIIALRKENAKLKQQLSSGQCCGSCGHNADTKGADKSDAAALTLSGNLCTVPSAYNQVNCKSFFSSLPNDKRPNEIVEPQRTVDFILKKPIKKRCIPKNCDNSPDH